MQPKISVTLTHHSDADMQVRAGLAGLKMYDAGDDVIFNWDTPYDSHLFKTENIELVDKRVCSCFAVAIATHFAMNISLPNR